MVFRLYLNGFSLPSSRNPCLYTVFSLYPYVFSLPSSRDPLSDYHQLLLCPWHGRKHQDWHLCGRQSERGGAPEPTQGKHLVSYFTQSFLCGGYLIVLLSTWCLVFNIHVVLGIWLNRIQVCSPAQWINSQIKKELYIWKRTVCKIDENKILKLCSVVGMFYKWFRVLVKKLIWNRLMALIKRHCIEIRAYIWLSWQTGLGHV